MMDRRRLMAEALLSPAQSPVARREFAVDPAPRVAPGQASVGPATSHFAPLDTVDPIARMLMRGGQGQTVPETARMYRQATDAALNFAGTTPMRGITAYHGSFSPNLTQLNNAHLGENFNNRASRMAHWFSTNPDDAAFYGDHIYEAVLNGRYKSLPGMEDMGERVLQRIQDIADNGRVSFEARERARHFLDYVQNTRAPHFYTDVTASQMSKARREGYDGVALRGGETVQTNSAPGDNYGVFSPESVSMLRRLIEE